MDLVLLVARVVIGLLFVGHGAQKLVGSFGGADFASWFNGHPDVPREWPLPENRRRSVKNVLPGPSNALRYRCR